MLFLFLACSSPQDWKDPETVTGTGGPRIALVDFLSPLDGDTVTNPVTFEVRQLGVHSAEIYADGWYLGSVDSMGQLTYDFHGVDYPRVITVEGLDLGGRVVATDQMTMVATEASSGSSSPAGTSGLASVPYYYQYDNDFEPTATCGLTSAAMLLGAKGRNRTPDALYRDYGKAQGQSPEALAELYRWEGLTADSGRTASRAELRAMLDAGSPVVVHGFWTSAGHIVTLVGYDNTGWLVHDPAGDWYHGYGSSWGESVHYPFNSAWDDNLSWDGDIWWSTAR